MTLVQGGQMAPVSPATPSGRMPVLDGDPRRLARDQVSRAGPAGGRGTHRQPGLRIHSREVELSDDATHDCAPTLNDTQVMDFCKNGFLMLDGVVPDEINRRTLEYVEAHPRPRADGHPARRLVCAERDVAAGGGGGGALAAWPEFRAAEFDEQPPGADAAAGPAVAPRRRLAADPALNYLQVFYFPQECNLESGPTELLPGSHFILLHSRHMAHYGQMRGTYYAAASAGSVFLTVYSVWHRRSASTATGLRNLLKYNYWRTTPPARNWIQEPGFNAKSADYTKDKPVLREQFQDCFDAAEMYYLAVRPVGNFHLMGGQGWPIPGTWLDGAYGFPGEPTNMRD